ncbi:hypothetical protein MHLNE_07280 [Moorella humiferrea]|uniref:Wzz/FepE/Etk N-terminal domain-containing protein n=1 Tax=Neomoorella humiferrea TaxID=676965 RepID=UPI0030D0F83D
MTPPYEEEVDLREFLRVLGRYRWFIAAVTLIAVLAAALASVFMPSVYRVEAVVEMEKTDAKGSQQSEGKAVLESRVLLKAALEGLGIATEPKEFKSRADAIKDTGYLRFTLEGRDAGQVAAVGAKMLELFLDQRNKIYEEYRLPMEKDLEKISGELERAGVDREKIAGLIADLEKSPLTEVEQKLYALQLAQIQSMQAQEKVGLLSQYLSLKDKLASMHPARIVDDLGEAEKVRPRLLLNTAVALVLGLMLGVFSALTCHWLKN